jgi:hypothetical protein
VYSTICSAEYSSVVCRAQQCSAVTAPLQKRAPLSPCSLWCSTSFDKRPPPPLPGEQKGCLPHITDIANVSTNELNDGHKSQCDSPATRPAVNYCSRIITSQLKADVRPLSAVPGTTITSTTSTGCYCCCIVCHISTSYINYHQFFHK